MAKQKNRLPWAGKVINNAQIGGIETAVLDDGPGRGVRIAWVNTGSGLRYKVVIDRCLDIADAFYNERSISWQSHGGVCAPTSDSNRELEWLYQFCGGLVVTCGLRQVGPPEEYGGESHGLHGRISNVPARLESIIQPDPVNGKMEMSISGVVKESRVFGPQLELHRTISSTIGEPVINIKDVVTNRGNTPVPHMMLYHCNYGWPLVDEGTDIIWRGKWESAGREQDNKLWNPRHNFRKAQRPMDDHRGAGEADGFINIAADRNGYATIGLCNNKLGLAWSMRFKKKQLPWVTNWQHWGPDEYVTGVEPGTSPPIGQAAAKKRGLLISLRPGQSRRYELEFRALTDAKEIAAFVKNAGPR